MPQITSQPTAPIYAPDSVSGLLRLLAVGWGGLAVVSLVLFAFSPVAKIAGFLTLVGATILVGSQMLRVMHAKRDVLTLKEVPILWGFARLVAWDPVEGVLFLRNKGVGFMDGRLDDEHGGIRCIYPALGDELALRVPLEVQTLEFSDEEVLTREYLSVTIRGSMRWQITDLRQFYLQLSRELRATGELADQRQQAQVRAAPVGTIGGTADTNMRGRLMTSAIEWLRLLAEERTRTVVSQVSSGLLIAERLTDSLQNEPIPAQQFTSLLGIPSAVAGSQQPWRSATERLSDSIAETVRSGVADSGISVLRVSLQEIKLPAGIVQACREAAQAAYLPLLAQRQAATKRAELSAEVDLLGQENVAAREIIAAAPPFTLVDFLSQFVSKHVGHANGGLSTSLVTGAMVASGLDQEATAPLHRPPS